MVVFQLYIKTLQGLAEPVYCQNVPLTKTYMYLSPKHTPMDSWKVKTYPCQEVKTDSCYRSKRTSMFPYNIYIF